MRAHLFTLALLASGTAQAAPCQQILVRDLAGDQAEVARVVTPVEKAHADQLKAFDATPGLTAAARIHGFLDLQRGYYQARLRALTPLAEHGNAVAMMGAARVRQSADSGLADPIEWTRLMHCAAALGEPSARLELMRETWHDKGDGSFEAIQRNRARTLDLVEQAARDGQVGGLSMLGVYIGGGGHQYPVEPDLGHRLLALCVRAGGGCRERLLEAAAYALSDPMDRYVLLADLARSEPVRYATRRDVAWAALAPDQQARVATVVKAWRPVAWAQLAAEWNALRAEIIAKGDPASVDCRHGHLCPRV